MNEHPFYHNLTPYFQELSQHHSLRSIHASSLYQKLKNQIETILSSYEVGHCALAQPEKEKYRIVAWNLERGMVYPGIIDAFKNHPVLSEADIVLAPETDLGMARSDNQNISEVLARALGWNYFFGPCYLNLAKGSGVEADAKGENAYGLHGNSIFSRYPLKDFHLIPLRNNKDKMRGSEKRLGNQQALVCTVCLPQGDLRVVCAHLDAHSSKRHRSDQIKTILDFLKKLPHLPTFLGGDFNTTTYNSRHAAFAIFGFWVRVAMGVRYMIRSHYPYPDRFFERALFRRMEKAGFDYKNFNVPGACTLHYHVKDIKKFRNLKDWIPDWCFKFVEWALKEQGGKCSFKIDWLAGRGVRAVPKSAQVIGELQYQEKEISDHDAIAVDFRMF